jgi:predicted  nucleic acid-binding Zn-ribbon protein
VSVDALRALLEADRWLDKVAYQRDHLAEQAALATVEASLRELVGALKVAQGELAPVRADLDHVAADAAKHATRLGELDKTLSAATGAGRDLTALHTEATHVRALLSQTEDRELELMEQIEPLEAAVAHVRESAKPLAARREELLSAIAALQTSLDEELVGLRGERASLAGALPDDVRQRYEVALQKVGVSGAANLIDGRCDGCRIALAPLELDRLRQLGHEQVSQCPECGRLLLT